MDEENNRKKASEKKIEEKIRTFFFAKSVQSLHLRKSVQSVQIKNKFSFIKKIQN